MSEANTANTANTMSSESEETVLSDERIKSNIEPVDVLDLQTFLLDLNPVEFSFNQNPNREIGLIAQDVVETIGDRRELKGLVNGIESYDPVFGNYPLLSINYTKFIPILITIVKEQEKRIRFLEENVYTG